MVPRVVHQHRPCVLCSERREVVLSIGFKTATMVDQPVWPGAPSSMVLGTARLVDLPQHRVLHQERSSGVLTQTLWILSCNTFTTDPPSR